MTEGDLDANGLSSLSIDEAINFFVDPTLLLSPERDAQGTICDFRLVSINNAAVTYWRFTGGDVFSERHSTSTRSLTPVELLEMYARVAETGESLNLDDYPVTIAPDGTVKYFDLRVFEVGGDVAVTWRDVTTEHESVEKYRLLAENASDVVFQADANYVIEWASPSVVNLIGKTVEQVVGLSMVDLVCEDDLEKVLDVIVTTEGGHRNVVECRLVCADGSLRWTSISAIKRVNQLGEIVDFVGSVRDIDDEYAGRQRLVESEERYRLLAQNASDVVMLSDSSGDLLWISESVTALTGYRPEELIGTRAEQYVHPDDLLALIAARQETLDHGFIDAFTTRFKTADGSYRWIDVTARTIEGPTGTGGRDVVRVTAWRDAERRVADQNRLIESERQFRLVAENSSDVIFQTDNAGMVEWISPSVTDVLGWEPRDVIGRPSLDLLVVDDVPRVVEWRRMLESGLDVAPHETRFRTTGKDFLWMSVHVRPIFDSQDKVCGAVVALRNSHTEVLTRRALNTMAAGSRGLVRASSEQQLLDEMCQTAVDEGGYELAWYGRRIDDEAHSVKKVAWSLSHPAYMEAVEVTWNDDTLGEGPMGHALRLRRTFWIAELADDHDFAPWLDVAQREGFRSVIALPVFVDDAIDGALAVYAKEPAAFDDFATTVLEDLAAELGYGLKRQRDRDRLSKSLADQSLLTSAIDQAGEAIVVTDVDSNIIYVNPAASRASGYRVDELIGANPRIFQSGLHSGEFYRQLWATLLTGESWRGVLISRKKNGELIWEDTTISPIRDTSGTTVAYVAVKHDLTIERRLAADLSREQVDRQAIVDVMREIHPADTVQATATVFCEALTRFTDVDVACVLLREESGTLRPVAISGSSIFDEVGMEAVALQSTVQSRLLDGPAKLMVEDELRSIDAEVADRAREEGVIAVVQAPIRWEGEYIGALVLGTKDPAVAETMEMRFTYFEELGTFSGTLFGAQARSYQDRSSSRAAIIDIIDHHRYHPVFQAFVDLSDGSVVGYEALTRFDDGERPDRRFLAAHSVGLGTELEAACAEAAIEAARGLSPEMKLSVNFSPASLLDGHAESVMGSGDRELILEITENAAIESYAAVRQAISRIKHCWLAVDDAGAGYSSLNHILELQPEYVKIDIAFVRDIDTNPARQAMVAGLCHFAAQSGTVIIAEGVETAEEAQALRKLGSSLGAGGMLAQGFYFSRPEPIDHVTT